MPTDTKITLREITAETLSPILKLKVAEHQNQFVAPNAVSIAQAHFSEHAWFRGIYAGDTPVGFVMLHIDLEKPECFLWRYMIDNNHQGNGYGYRAMQLVIEYVRNLPGISEFDLSYVRSKGDPSGFYAKLGFVDTGRMIDGEYIMLLEF
ncbi:MAG: GNAT family N-acetyltransferase [candidate division Zixibacteria bacterium]|nr:GNAT family N-acetyltransferase [candidate division Zixibacteria bacterium]MDH3936460.1 GNAT family N-acetyltransferase [candidate division Zixibacteria bacterium]MDH4033105.1 GNAT family N-acetyltransferase [candidate division Zixibacteria bacterium]